MNRELALCGIINTIDGMNRPGYPLGAFNRDSRVLITLLRHVDLDHLEEDLSQVLDECRKEVGFDGVNIINQASTLNKEKVLQYMEKEMEEKVANRGLSSAEKIESILSTSESNDEMLSRMGSAGIPGVTMLGAK